jgi:hypothetical protein
MATVLLSPVGNGQQFFDNNGIPLAGGLIYTYQAGSSTLLTTYTTVNGNIANTNPIVLDAYGRTPSEIWMQTGYSYKFIIQTSAAVTLQTLDNLYPILQTATATVSPVPTGSIFLWSGSIGSIPSGYLICDGTLGTPDLRDRFIVGAGANYAVAATGGSADAIVVTHTHTVTDPGHTHNTNVYITNSSAAGGNSSVRVNASDPTTITSASSTTGITNQSTGTSGTNANLPPYYALAYIMKT